MLHLAPRARWRPTAAIVAVAVLALVGCAGQQDAGADDASTPPAPELPAPEGHTDYPMTVTTAVGEVVIEQRPSRIVMASSWDGDLFAALGVTPVATDEQIAFYSWTTERFDGEIETIWPTGDETYPAETIAASEPDLIVDTLAVDSTAVHEIGAVAPVLGAPVAEDAPTWRDRLRLLGEVLDLSDRAQQVIADYDESFETISADHPEFAGVSIDYVAFYGAEYGADLLNVAGADAESLFGSLGFASSPSAEDTALEDGLSDELLGTLSGDVLVISNQDAEGFDDFFSNPLIQGLESVQSGRVVILDVDGAEWTVSHDGEPTGFHGHFGRAFNYGPLAHLELADLLVPLLADVLE